MAQHGLGQGDGVGAQAPPRRRRAIAVLAGCVLAVGLSAAALAPAAGASVPDISLTPMSDSATAGGNHTVTATVMQDGSPLTNAIVTFTVTGQNDGASGTCTSSADCSTDDNGNIAFTYSDANGAGDDTITASVPADDPDQASASMTWTEATPPTPPAATDDSYTVQENGTLTVPAPGVLGNDTGTGPLSVDTATVTNPSDGTVTVNPDGSFTYNPDTNFTGSDSFTYEATDGTSDSDPATVSIGVFGTGDPSHRIPISASGSSLFQFSGPVIKNLQKRGCGLLTATAIGNGTVATPGSKKLQVVLPITGLVVNPDSGAIRLVHSGSGVDLSNDCYDVKLQSFYIQDFGLGSQTMSFSVLAKAKSASDDGTRQVVFSLDLSNANFTLKKHAVEIRSENVLLAGDGADEFNQLATGATTGPFADGQQVGKGRTTVKFGF